MSVLYKDKSVILDEKGIILRLFFVPLGRDKRINYDEIEKVTERKMSVFLERMRLWGPGSHGTWFNWDFNRPLKDKCIIIETKKCAKVGITPADHDKVLALLSDKICT